MRLESFKKNFTLLNNRGMKKTKVFDAEDFQLPLGAILHYISQEVGSLGIRGSEIVLTNYRKSIKVYHEKEIEVNHGRASKVSVDLKRMERNHLKSQGRFNMTRDLDRIMGVDKLMIIFDYSFLTQTLKYADNVRSLEFEWLNLREAMLKNVALSSHRRPNFLLHELPEKIPTYGELNLVKEKLTTEQLSEFTSQDDFNLLDLWRYMDGKGTLVGVSEEEAKNTYFVFREGTKIVNFNLYDLGRAQREEVDLTVLQKEFLGVLESLRAAANENQELEPEEEKEEEVEDFVEARLKELVENKILSPAEQKRFRAIAAKMDEITVPGFGKVSEVIADKTEPTFKTKLNTAIERTISENALHATTDAIKSTYIEKQMMKDTMEMLMSLKRSGILLKDIEVETVRDAQDNMLNFKIPTLPIRGVSSPLVFQFPIVNPKTQQFVVSGNKYTMDMQRADVPIRKSSPSRVALTSYGGKIFIDRSPKVADNYATWLTKRIIKASLDKEAGLISGLKYVGTKRFTEKVPLIYSGLAEKIRSFKSKGITFNFDYAGRFELFGEDAVKKAETKDYRVIGKQKDSLILVNEINRLYRLEGNDYIDIGTIEEVTGIGGNAPKDFSVVGIFRKKIPLVVMLSYLMGFEKMLKRLGVKYRAVKTGTREPMEPWEIKVRFKDWTLYVDGRNREHSLLFAGFKPVRDSISGIQMKQLNNRSGFSIISSDLDIKVFHLKEMELMEEAFIDPITQKNLKKINEPEEFIPLLRRANQLLTNDDYPNETDTDHQRFKGYERFPGLLYSRLYEALREYKMNHNPRLARVSMKPNAVLMDIISDQSVLLVEDINPIHTLKEREAINLGGKGGRDTKTLVKKSRVFDPKDLGVVSEGTPDSTKVGIRTYATQDANFKDIYGLTRRYDPSTDGAASVLSTAANQVPGINHDDAKRVNMLSVQLSALVGCKNYEAMPYRSGGEASLGARLDEQYTFIAPEDGKIIEVTDEKIVLETKEAKKAYSLKVKHGKASGMVFPHKFTTDMKVGDKVKSGDILAWNEAFFERDWLNPRNVNFTLGVPALIAFMEEDMTHEDSSAISARLASKLVTGNSTEITVIVKYDQNIFDLKKIGDAVDIDDILCVIQDAELTEQIGTDTTTTIGHMTKDTPKAKKKGTITDIKVVHVPGQAEMTDSLKKVIDAENRSRKKEIKEFDADIHPSCEILNPTFVNGSKLEKNMVAISFFIDEELDVWVGDKAVASAQLKTIFGNILPDGTRTKSGNPIDGIFSWRASQARIVLTSVIAGVANRVLRKVSSDSVDAYFEEYNS